MGNETLIPIRILPKENFVKSNTTSPTKKRRRDCAPIRSFSAQSELQYQVRSTPLFSGRENRLFSVVQDLQCSPWIQLRWYLAFPKPTSRQRGSNRMYSKGRHSKPRETSKRRGASSYNRSNSIPASFMHTLSLSSLQYW